MQDAALYHQVNHMQRRDATNIMDEYADRIQWRRDGRDRLIDIGCGPGNVLLDIVRPRMPKHFDQIVGVDISTEMVNFAREKYAHVERTSFQILDIRTEVIPENLRERFDHVTSFYCLNYLPDLQKALCNIHNLLRDSGGDCILMLSITHAVFDAYHALANNSKWSPYMHDQFLCALYSSEDPGKELRQIVKKAGFVDYTVSIRDQEYTLEGAQKFRDFIKPLMPCFEHMPKELHESFLDDFLNVSEIKRIREYIPEKNDYKFKLSYKQGLIYARKVSKGVKSGLV